jgi:hypothetical protein
MTRQRAVLLFERRAGMGGRAGSLYGLWSAFAVALAVSSPAMAADQLSGVQIKQTVAGNTVQGSMEGTGAYAEFYQQDGTIKGEGYSGVWSIEGDEMCFQYGSDPKTCFDVVRDGDAIQWIKDGKVEGTGTLAPGNPLNY